MLTTKAQARKLAGLRKTHTGGRPCIPTRCEKCGTMCPSRTLAEVTPVPVPNVAAAQGAQGRSPAHSDAAPDVWHSMSKPQTRQGAPVLAGPEEISCFLEGIVSGLKPAVAGTRRAVAPRLRARRRRRRAGCGRDRLARRGAVVVG